MAARPAMRNGWPVSYALTPLGVGLGTGLGAGSEDFR